MDYYPYPDYEDENSSCCSAEIEGGVAAVGPITAKHESQGDDQKNPPNEGSANISDLKRDRDDSGGYSAEKEYFRPLDEGDSSQEVSQLSSGRNVDIASNGGSNIDQNEQTNSLMATLIKNERNRRLGIRGTDDDSIPRSHSSCDIPAAANPGVGVLDNIIGWFGGGGANNSDVNRSASSQKPLTGPRESSASVIKTGPSRRSSAPDGHVHNNPSSLMERRGSDHLIDESQLENSILYHEEDGDYSSSSSGGSYSSEDSDSTSNFSNASNNKHLGGEANLSPQERARIRALRYLSNSCVDARRRAKTTSYVRGLERLDLKRKEDRCAKELEVVETEMNKDRGLANGYGERDAISAMAAKLVRELPCIQGADAGAGSGRGKNLGSGESFMSYDDYADALNNDTSNLSDDTHGKPSLWENVEAVDVYVNSLQSRLKGALERTRSLEKRLVVLEQTGDDIVSSLCEDLAEVAADSNKAEARYVKKGKELQRKSRREEMQQLRKIRQAERHIQKLGEQMMSVVEGRNTNEYSNTIGDFTDSADDENDEYDEILLEQKLLTIKTKNKQAKEDHQSEVDSIRRQCEQLKLRLSVARLVMEGDDNLREYVSLLERLNPSTRKQRNNCTSDDDNNHDFSGIHRDNIPALPPSRITRARAKLLKVTHLEKIYEQRLAVSKAFTDATINALEQELSERENDRQKMEVKCLNDLLLIDTRIKDVVQEGTEKMAELELEAQGLEDAIATFAAEKSVASVNAMFGCNDIESAPAMPEESTPIMANKLSRYRSIDDEKDNDIQQEGTGQVTNSDFLHVADGIYDKSEMQEPAIREHVINEPSNEMSINEEDNDEEQVNIGHIPDEASRKMSIDKDDNGEVQLETDENSHAESLQTKKDMGDVSPLPDSLQNCYDPIERVPLSAATDVDNIDAECINGSHEKYVRINHDVEDSVSFGGGEENGDNSHSNSDFSLSKETANKTEELADTEYAYVECKAATQRKPPLECSTDHDDVNGVAADGQMSQGCKDGRNKTASELPNPNTAADLCHGGIDCDQRINRGESDIKEEGQRPRDPKRMVVVELLGRELKCALADYQTSVDLSSSSDRIKQLNHMNGIVAKIGKVHWGIEPNSQPRGKSMLKSWSSKKLRSSSDREQQEKKRSRRRKKKKSRQRDDKERREVKMNGPDDIVERFGKSLIW